MNARLPTLAMLVGASLAAACGGSSSSTSGAAVSGTAVKGPVSGASVVAYAVASGAMVAPIASSSTDSMGNFSIPVGSYSGPMMLQLSGGSYVDEATGTTMPMLSGDVMEACLPSVAAGAATGGTLLAALLTAVDPHAIFYAQEARGYAMVQLLAVLHLGLFFERLRGAAGWRVRWAWIASAVVMFYLHYTTALVVLAEARILRWNRCHALRSGPPSLQGASFAQVVQPPGKFPVFAKT